MKALVGAGINKKSYPVWIAFVDWERRVSNLFVQNLERFGGIG